MTDGGPTTLKPSFGFGNLDDFQPAPPTPPTTRALDPAAPPAPARKPAPRPEASRQAEIRAADRAGAQHGFHSRESAIRRRKRQPIEEPVDQINLRAAIADINRFVEWCEVRRYSYREGFAELVRRIDA